MVNDRRPRGRYGHGRHCNATGRHSRAPDVTCRMPTRTSATAISTPQTVDECTIDQGINEGTVDPHLLPREKTGWSRAALDTKHEFPNAAGHNKRRR